MDKCVQMLDKNYGALGPDGPGVRREESPRWRELEESPKEKTWTVEDRDWSGKKGETMNAGGVGELE
ncbi:hypothetical protein TNCV_83201 [Trichonephila clavipes]|nr:hypothetical protein TNCV_83201 [Trichonephila clavipes]